MKQTRETTDNGTTRVTIKNPSKPQHSTDLDHQNALFEIPSEQKMSITSPAKMLKLWTETLTLIHVMLKMPEALSLRSESYTSPMSYTSSEFVYSTFPDAHKINQKTLITKITECSPTCWRTRPGTRPARRRNGARGPPCRGWCCPPQGRRRQTPRRP